MLLILPPVIFVSTGFLLYEPVSLLSSSVLTLTTIIIFLLKYNEFWRLNKMQLPVIILPIAYLVSAMINSQKLESFLLGAHTRNFGLATLISFSLIFLLVCNSKLEEKLIIDRSFFVILLLAILYGCIQYFGFDPIQWRSEYSSITLTLGNSNFAGALYGILTIIPITRLFYARSSYTKMFYLVIAIISVFLGVKTDTLQFIVLLLISFLVCILVTIFRENSKFFRIVKYLIFVIPMISLLSLAILRSLKIQVEFINKIFIEGNISQRLDYWRTGINIWQDNKLFGVGIDQFQRYAGLYRTPVQILRDGDMVIPDKSHNVFIDHFANGGLAAGVTWMIFVACVYFSLFRTVWKRIENRADIAILASIWTAYILQSLISPDHILLTLIGYISGGLIIRNSLDQFDSFTTSTNQKKYKYFFIRTICILLFPISLIFFSKVLISSYNTREFFSNSNPSYQAFEGLVSDWPNTKALEELGVFLGKNPNNCKLTEVVATKLVEIDDRSSQGWFMKGVCASAQLNFESAIEYVDNSLKFDPFNPYYLISKAKLEIAANQLDQAAQTVAKVKAIKPSEPEIGALESSIAVLQKKTD
jgi:O-antigen ligase